LIGKLRQQSFRDFFGTIHLECSHHTAIFLTFKGTPTETKIMQMQYFFAYDDLLLTIINFSKNYFGL